MTDRFLVMDNKTEQAWWRYGAGKETPEEAQRKRMTREQFGGLVTSLTDWNVI